MYKAVRQTAEDNTPENYLPMAGAGKKLLGEVAGRITGKENTGLGTGLLTDNTPEDETAPDSAGSSKPNAAAASDTPEQANGVKPPSSEPGAADQPNHEAEEPAAAGAAMGSTPNEEGETEEAPLLQRDDKAAAAKK